MEPVLIAGKRPLYVRVSRVHANPYRWARLVQPGTGYASYLPPEVQLRSTFQRSRGIILKRLAPFSPERLCSLVPRSWTSSTHTSCGPHCLRTITLLSYGLGNDFHYYIPNSLLVSTASSINPPSMKLLACATAASHSLSHSFPSSFAGTYNLPQHRSPGLSLISTTTLTRFP